MTKIVSIITLTLTRPTTLGQMKSRQKQYGKKIVDDFVNAINEHNVDRIYLLMTDDHIFVDAHGNEVSGKDKMKTGWTVYFQWFPDYKIEITNIFANGDTLAAF